MQEVRVKFFFFFFSLVEIVFKNLQSQIDSLQQRVDELEAEVASQSDDLATCEGKFDEIYSEIETILSNHSNP